MTPGRDSAVADAGFTLVELLVASAVLAIGLAMFGAVLFVVQKAQVRFDEYSRANDEVHLAIQDLDRELRSGYVVSTGLPSWAGGMGEGDKWIPDGNSLVVYTEANGRAECVRWLLYPATGIQRLYRRSWDPTKGGADQPIWSIAGNKEYRRVADDVVNGSARAPFSLAEPPDGVNAIIGLVVSFWVNVPEQDGELRGAQEIEIESQLFPRNAARSGQDAIGGSVAREASCEA